MPKRFLPSLEGLSIRSRGNTPHWEVADAFYSITYRLHDSLPLSILAGGSRIPPPQANLLLGQRGPFWQSEYYDRIIRDGEDLENTVAYVAHNPSKAGLENWRWVWKKGEPLVYV